MSIAHLITHLSISQLNMWRATPKKYGKCYLKGERESVPQMWRGTAVEKGLEFFLRGGNPDDALKEAYQIYEQEVARNAR